MPTVMHKRPINIKTSFNSDFDFSDSSLHLDSSVAGNEMSRHSCFPVSLNFYPTAHFYFLATAHWHILFCSNRTSQPFCKTKRANFANPPLKIVENIFHKTGDILKILETILYMVLYNKKGGVYVKMQ